MTTLVIAKAVLISQSDEVLLLRRSSTDTERPGEQDFPGGWIDQGEGLEQGLCREIYEEAGISVQPDDVNLFYARTIEYEDKNVVQTLFYVFVPDLEIKLSDEHDSFLWLTGSEAAKAFPHPFYGEGLKFGLEHKLFVK